METAKGWMRTMRQKRPALNDGFEIKFKLLNNNKKSRHPGG